MKDSKFTIGIKLNSVEFQQEGFKPEECRDVCARLEELGVDFIELSGGTYEDNMANESKRESTIAREGGLDCIKNKRTFDRRIIFSLIVQHSSSNLPMLFGRL